ncbi:MAG TPA: glycosyltransferase family 87 protein [Terriglobales bacterium]|nr:glycosyltransferase family 87 protein [Terriglobales bacterium]
MLERIAEQLRTPTIVALLWMVALAQALRTATLLSGQDLRSDFSIIYVSAMVLRQRGDPYSADFDRITRQLGADTALVHRATDPPSFVLLTQPLAFLQPAAASKLWLAANAAFFALSLWLIVSEFPECGLTLVALAIIYPPVAIHFFFAQKNLVILLLVSAMIWLMNRSRHRSAGLCLALAVLMRLFPATIVGYLVVERRWLALRWCLAGLGIGILLTVWFIGLQRCLSFWDNGIQVAESPTFMVQNGNIALRAAIWRAFRLACGLSLTPELASLRSACVAMAEALLLGFTIRASFEFRHRDDPHWCVLSLWIVTSILMSPTVWPHYLVLMLIPFAALISAGSSGKLSARTQWASLVAYLGPFAACMIVGGADATSLARSPLLAAVSVGSTWFYVAFPNYIATYWCLVDLRRIDSREPLDVASGRSSSAVS